MSYDWGRTESKYSDIVSDGGMDPRNIKPSIYAMTEPIAWMVYTEDGKSVFITDNPTDIKEGQRALPLYTKQEWQGLTDEERAEIAKSDPYRPTEMMKLAEAKLKEKNGG